jgi:uncharacterized protein
MTLSSEARVTTDRPDRYGSQLVKHFANKIEASWADGAGNLAFGMGTASLQAEDGVLRMRVSAADQESLTRMQEVVGSHLVRFGQRDELVVEWQPVGSVSDAK